VPAHKEISCRKMHWGKKRVSIEMRSHAIANVGIEMNIKGFMNCDIYHLVWWLEKVKFFVNEVQHITTIISSCYLNEHNTSSVGEYGVIGTLNKTLNPSAAFIPPSTAQLLLKKPIENDTHTVYQQKY
jgi:hypothetical protein